MGGARRTRGKNPLESGHYTGNVAWWLNTDSISLTDRTGWSMISSLKLIHQYTPATILNGTESNPYPVKPDYEIKYVIG